MIGAASAALLLSGCQLGLDREALLQIYAQRSSSVAAPRTVSKAPPTAPPSAPMTSPMTPPGALPGPRTSAPAEERALGEACRSERGESGLICLALRYVVFRDEDGAPILSEREVLHNLEGINRIWAECGIRFQIERYAEVRPAALKVAFRTDSYSELNEIRRRLRDEKRLLVVTTGEWNRRGALGNTGANAWTNMPGDGLYGVVLERSVGDFPNLIAHEIGHYLSLDHVDDASDVMHPVIHERSTRLTREQCDSARWAVRAFWENMVR